MQFSSDLLTWPGRLWTSACEAEEAWDQTTTAKASEKMPMSSLHLREQIAQHWLLQKENQPDKVMKPGMQNHFLLQLQTTQQFFPCFCQKGVEAWDLCWHPAETTSRGHWTAASDYWAPETRGVLQKNKGKDFRKVLEFWSTHANILP